MLQTTGFELNGRPIAPGDIKQRRVTENRFLHIHLKMLKIDSRLVSREGVIFMYVCEVLLKRYYVTAHKENETKLKTFQMNLRQRCRVLKAACPDKTRRY